MLIYINLNYIFYMYNATARKRTVTHLYELGQFLVLLSVLCSLAEELSFVGTPCEPVITLEYTRSLYKFTRV